MDLKNELHTVLIRRRNEIQNFSKEELLELAIKYQSQVIVLREIIIDVLIDHVMRDVFTVFFKDLQMKDIDDIIEPMIKHIKEQASNILIKMDDLYDLNMSNN